jgi:hypothetical protein
MHIFSIYRIGALLKRDVMENQKTYLKIALGFLLALILAIFIIMLSPNTVFVTRSLSGANFLFAKSMSSTFFIIYIWTLYVISASMMQNMQTKEQRINYLMVPATRIEKYLSRLLLTTLVPLVALIVLVLAADILHMFLSLFIGIPGVTDHWAFPLFFRRLSFQGLESEWFDYPVIDRLLRYVMFFWSQSLFVLGGCFWTKSAFLKTLATIFVLMIVLIIGFATIAAHNVDFFFTLNHVVGEWIHAHKWFSEELALSLLTVLFFCFTVLNYWLGYRLFSRTQIIRPKFLGL